MITGKCKHTDWKPSGGLVGMCSTAGLAYQKHEMHQEKIEDTSFSSFFLRIKSSANLTQRFLISRDKEVKS